MSVIFIISLVILEDENSEGKDGDRGGVEEEENDREGAREGGGVNTGGGVLLPLLLLAVTATVAVVVFLVWRRRYSYKTGSLFFSVMYNYRKTVKELSPLPFSTGQTTTSFHQLYYSSYQHN